MFRKMKEILATCFIPVAIMIIQQVWIVHTYQERNVPVGEMVELECPFDTSLAIWVYWKKDNETIYSLKVEPQGVTSRSNGTERYEVTSQAKYLTITDLRETDSGVYDCKVVKDIPEYILDSAKEGSLVRLSVVDQVEVVPSTTSSVPYNTSEKIPVPPAKKEDGLGSLSLLILIPIAVIIVIMCRKRSRIQEYINGRCMAARKRRGYKMNSSGSHDDPEGAQSVPLVKPDESLRKNDDSGSNAPQKRIHGHDGEQQQENDSVESQIHRSELTPEFDASPFSIEEEIGHGPPNDDDNVDARPGDGANTHQALIHGEGGEQQQGNDSVDSEISEFIPREASSPFPNKENSKASEYQLPLVGKVLLIDIHRAKNQDAVVERVVKVVHEHVKITGRQKPPKGVKHRPSLEKFAKDRYPDQSFADDTIQYVVYVLNELDQIPSGRWRDRCEVLLTMPDNQQQDKSMFYSKSIHDSIQAFSENDSNDDNPERREMLEKRMKLWMANPDKRNHARYFISREILYADVPDTETLNESFINFRKSVPNVGYEVGYFYIRTKYHSYRSKVGKPVC
ncbi:uncharacterized protein LOC121414220 isoform X4 [Lytechinus variegatus]|uniref:uncharacterized protein LOC121414220 isoform X4 n=1 Tax=Lytechinus variegatus TaxID=7654 RepID=UPI001BB14B6C|nr:uncharacterized protein LOC121414220 isoform X4 [Lytechinus variegatus]